MDEFGIVFLDFSSNGTNSENLFWDEFLPIKNGPSRG